MKFNWDGFTEEDFVNYCAMVENNMYPHDECVGNIRVGDLCFDLLIRGNSLFTYDCYIGGVDTGYGISKDNYPYDELDGGAFVDTCISMTYDNFKEYAESVLEAFICDANPYYDEADLEEKANKELHIW